MQLFKKNKTLVGAYIFFLIISLIASTQLDAQTIQPKDSTALQKDSTALVALYNSTDGPHWKENSGWLSGPIKMWYGIYLNSRLTRVTSIALSDNNLNGTIPSEIGKLTGVRNIMLDNNQLIGTIPSEISNISNLITLNLYKNELSGNIPSSISKLTYLTALNIQYNHFNFSDLYSSSFSPLSQSFVYAPQKKLPEPTLSQDGDEITLAIDEDMASYHIVWYVNGSPVEENNSTFYTFIPTETTTVYVKITDLGYTNLTLETNPVIIEPAQQPKDTTPPVVVTQNISVQLDETGHTSIVSTQIDNGSSDENGIASRTLSQSDFDCDNIGENTVTLTVTDNNGNSTFAYAVVTVEDKTAPVVITQNVTLQLDQNGFASITPEQVNIGSSDACGIASMILSQSDFDCDNIGENTVTLTVTDNSGNSANANAIVTVEDKTAPVAVAQNVTLRLDQNGFASITPEQVNNRSSDACGIASMILSQSDFDCDNIGENTVTLTVTDNNGNSTSAYAVVTVEDKTAPVAITRNIKLYLDQNGFASITPELVNNGSSDACGIASMTLSQSDFDCDNIGENTVTLTVTDNNGNSTSAYAVVTVEDKTTPVAVAQNVTLRLDQNGFASITPEQVNNRSSDACGIAFMTLSQTDFDCDNIGENTVTLTVTDNNGNSTSANAVVTVEDKTAPVAITRNIKLYLDQNGFASITPEQVNNGSSDACGIASMTLSQTDFDLSMIGQNRVELSVSDISGNISKAEAFVTVLDLVPPTANAQDLIVYLDEEGTATITADQIDNGSSDASGILSKEVIPSSFSCSNVGSNPVILTVTDKNGNISSDTVAVVVLDTIAPVAKARNLTIQLDANGSAHVNASDLNNGSSDACGIVSMQVVPSSFSCENIGENKVIFTVTDNNNNYSSIEATITVEDKIAPTIIAPSDITMNSESETNEDNSDYGWEGFFGWGLYWSWESCFSWNQSPGVYHTRCGSGGGLSGNPGGTTVELGTPVASDNCTIATITNDAPSQFPIGLTIVTWTVTDVNGNSSKTTQNITILDGGSSSNETPMINSMSSNSPVCVNSNATVTALVTDENLIRATWDWGDGTNSETTLSMNQKKVSQSYITASHRYNQSGMYDVTLTIEDKYEKTATMVYRSVVVFDPNNGDITGGGWINSNKGDYVVRKCNEKGNYGFVAQYDKRMNLQGNLTFQLSNSRFTLKSTSLDWLLINDDHALLKGEATVNCMPGYTFLVNAVDIDIHSTNKKDKDIFRIIVWDYDGNIVYDNESSAGMYDRPATPIGSGSIVIHQPKTDNKNHYKSVDITEATSGDADNNLFGNLKVYPNPATCLLNIDLPKRAEQAVSYDIVDVTGKVVTQDAKLELYGQTAWINLESYPMKPGSYILRLKEKDGTQSSWFRFIKK